MVRGDARNFVYGPVFLKWELVDINGRHDGVEREW